MPWLVSGWLAGVLLLSLRLLGGWWSTRVLRVVDVSPVPEWCRAQLTAPRRACDRPPGGDRVFDPGLGAGDRGPREAGDRASRGGAVGTERFAARGHPRARARACPASRLPGEPRPDGDRDAALLPSGRLVGLPSGAVAREHCCDDLAVTVCRSRQELRARPARSRRAQASTALLALGATDGSLLAAAAACWRRRTGACPRRGSRRV